MVEKLKKRKESIKIFGDVLFNKKLIRQWKDFRENFIDLELIILVKFLCLVLMIKDGY